MSLQLKEIKNFSGYFIREDGIVFSSKRGELAPLNPRLLPNGYLRVYMRDNRDNKRKDRYIHRLVAQAFIDNLECKKVVHHIDADRTNNHVSNLERVTHKENNQYTLDEGSTIRCKETGRFISGL